MSAQVEEKTVEQQPHIEEIEEDSKEEILEQSEEAPIGNAEKKARKAMKDFGLKPVEGITRVTFKRGGDILAIDRPVVYKSDNSPSWMVFGALQKVANPMAQAQDAIAQAEAAQLANPDAAEGENEEEQKEETAEDEEEVDATGVEEKDIELVVSQANVSRNKAVKALKNNSNDVVNAIMELTM